jgi:hypothetical protein
VGEIWRKHAEISPQNAKDISMVMLSSEYIIRVKESISEMRVHAG